MLVLPVVAENRQNKLVWNGTIQVVNGVRIINNPKEPLFGDMEFMLDSPLNIGNKDDLNYSFNKIRDIEVDKYGNIYVLDTGNHRLQKFDSQGRYLQTYGNTEQGSGKLETPLFINVADSSETIYVNNNQRAIISFNSDGKYLGEIKPEGKFAQFFFDSNKGYWGKFLSPGLRSIKRIGSNGEINLELIEIPFDYSVNILNTTKTGEYVSMQSLFIIHGYERDLHITKLGDNHFVYGDSNEYELNEMDMMGKLVLKIKKAEPYEQFSSTAIESIETSIKNRAPIGGYDLRKVHLKFPEHVPFFVSLLTDDLERIYVQRTPKNKSQSESGEFDIFSKEGHYLYRVFIPARPFRLRKGFLYTISTNELSGAEVVQRFKIKNWDQLKDSAGLGARAVSKLLPEIGIINRPY